MYYQRWLLCRKISFGRMKYLRLLFTNYLCLFCCTIGPPCFNVAKRIAISISDFGNNVKTLKLQFIYEAKDFMYRARHCSVTRVAGNSIEPRGTPGTCNRMPLLFGARIPKGAVTLYSHSPSTLISVLSNTILQTSRFFDGSVYVKAPV